MRASWYFRSLKLPRHKVQLTKPGSKSVAGKCDSEKTRGEAGGFSAVEYISKQSCNQTKCRYLWQARRSNPFWSFPPGSPFSRSPDQPPPFSWLCPSAGYGHAASPGLLENWWIIRWIHRKSPLSIILRGKQRESSLLNKRAEKQTERRRRESQ